MRIWGIALVIGASLTLWGCDRSSSTGRGIGVSNSGVAIPSWDGAIVTQGGMAYFVGSESSQANLDLNGDGDAADNVVYTLDPSTGTVVNLRRSAVLPLYALDNFVVWLTSEFQEGGRDFSGDGDTGDHVLTIWDPAVPRSNLNPRVTNHAISPGAPILTDGDTLAFLISEFESREDFNGDTDASDFQVRSYHIPTATRRTSGSVVLDIDLMDEDTLPIGLGNGILAFAGESGGANSAMYINLETGSLVDINLAVAGSVRVAGTATAPVVVFAVDESVEDRNLNQAVGDGDKNDSVLCVHKVALLDNVFPFGGIAVDPNRFAYGGDRLVAIAIEADNGLSGDLNGDFDQEDRVAFWLDTDRPLVATSFGVAAAEEPFLQVCDNYCVFLASEEAQGSGGTNYNGAFEETPDTTDSVAFWKNLVEGGAIVNTQYATDGLICVEDESFFMLTSPEADQGRDLNSNERLDDIVPIYFRVVGGGIIEGVSEIFIDGPIALEVCEDYIRIFGNASEATAFGGDMNFDEDDEDFLICAAEIRRSDGKWSSFKEYFTSDRDGSSRPLVVDGTVYFPFAEDKLSSGENLNSGSGDLDSGDLLLFFSGTGCN